jgi:hypothetical protein
MCVFFSLAAATTVTITHTASWPLLLLRAALLAAAA